MMRSTQHPTALWVQQFLGSSYAVLEFDQPTHSAAQAAAAIGCTIAQIAKSLVFAGPYNRPVLVIASGANRVDEEKLAALVGGTICRADADFVKQNTGFSIGGVPPVGHKLAPEVLLDADLRIFDEIWAAGGTPNAVFKLTPVQLKQLTGGIYCDVKSIDI
jgi:prolyl-tRNA editing enzyme YbaK/EbsC (Cys-tRNA(Pro) deacylase)|tara:strand:- start:449 stop:931 length:483 start_codon:yes stop_codon:yes gene_type:complete